MSLTSENLSIMAPTGKLRVSINVGNPILARIDQAGNAVGVSVDLAKEFAVQAGLDIELCVYQSAGDSVAAVSNGKADFGFFAIDPLRAEKIIFTEPYVLIEGCYLVRNDSPIISIDQVDVRGATIVVGKGSAYDLYLTRELKNANIIRSPTSPSVVDTFIFEKSEVAAGVKQQLEFDADRIGGLRVLPHRFMEIRQAMGLRKGLGHAAVVELRHFLERAKSSGFVAKSLKEHDIVGATVAPLATEIL